MTHTQTSEAIQSVLLDSQFLALFNYKGFDPILNQVDLYCDPKLSQENIREIEDSLKESVSSKLSVVIFRRKIQ